ncbi:MAG: protein kinase [Phycisphaerae bacterium]|nr:protein kinase [Phycisphaerae bacterium]
MAKYRKGKQINAGGFGVLYEGICVDDNTPCVLKYLKPDYDEDDLRRFKREVRLQTQLQHPNITPIVASNLDAEPPWFVMPKAAMNLRQFVSGGWMDDARHVFKHV